MNSMKIPNSIKICLLLFLGIISSMYSCQTKTKDKELRLIARVNDYEITLKDFMDQIHRGYPYKELDKISNDLKRKVLDDMIEQQLFLREAYRLNYDKNKEVIQYVESKERELAGNALVKQIAAPKTVTDDLLEKYYQWLDKDFNLYYIKLKTGLFDEKKEDSKQKAKNLYAKLQGSADFKVLAAEYSEHPTAKVDSGKLPRVTCFEVYEEIVKQANRMKEGDISTPFYTDNAYYIIKVDKIYQKNKESFESEKDYLIEDLNRYYENKNILKNEEINRYVKDEYHYQILSENIDFFCKRTKRMTARNDTTGLFTKKEKELVLSKTDVEEIKIGEFLPKVLEYYWDSLTQKRVVLMLLEYMNNKRLIKHKAMEMKLNESPKVQKNLELWLTNYLKNMVIRKQVLDKIDVSDPVIKPIYEREKMNLALQKEIAVREIFCKTKEQIDKVYNLAIHNNDFEALEQKYNQNQETRTRGLLGPFTKGRNGKLGEIAFNGMQVGDIGKPFRYRGGYSIIKIVAIEQARLKTYQEAKDELVEQYKEKNKDRFLSNWLQKIKPNYHIQVFELP